MENKIYYTIEKQTQTIDTIEECNGYKNIQVYRIKNNQPKIWFQIEARNDEYSENEIQFWLDNNGFDEMNFEMILL
jgi:cupin superfamily acireductone dioxygenase involved in methionine salvage